MYAKGVHPIVVGGQGIEPLLILRVPPISPILSVVALPLPTTTGAARLASVGYFYNITRKGQPFTSGCQRRDSDHLLGREGLLRSLVAILHGVCPFDS